MFIFIQSVVFLLVLRHFNANELINQTRVDDDTTRITGYYWTFLHETGTAQHTEYLQNVCELAQYCCTKHNNQLVRLSYLDSFHGECFTDSKSRLSLLISPRCQNIWGNVQRLKKFSMTDSFHYWDLYIGEYCSPHETEIFNCADKDKKAIQSCLGKILSQAADNATNPDGFDYYGNVLHALEGNYNDAMKKLTNNK